MDVISRGKQKGKHLFKCKNCGIDNEIKKQY